MLSPKARPILERLAFVIYLMMLVCSIGVTSLGAIIGCVTGDFLAMGLALMGLGVSRCLHVHGYAHWHFRECEESLNMIEAPGFLPRSEREEALAEEITALFTKLGEEEDVWVRGEFKREIGTRLEEAPALRADFADELSRHPGL